MKTPKAGRKRKKPLILTLRDENILRAIYEYRYMTAFDVAWLLFKPTSKTHVREILKRLPAGVIYRPIRIVPLRIALSWQCRAGVYVGCKRPRFPLRTWFSYYLVLPAYKLKHFSYSHVQHNLVLTRFLVALNVWIRKQKDFTLQRYASVMNSGVLREG